MIVERNGRVYHDEHDIEVTISNDNTKQTKVCKVKVRSDGDWNDVLTKALELYKESVK